MAVALSAFGYVDIPLPFLNKTSNSSFSWGARDNSTPSPVVAVFYSGDLLITMQTAQRMPVEGLSIVLNNTKSGVVARLYTDAKGTAILRGASFNATYLLMVDNGYNTVPIVPQNSSEQIYGSRRDSYSITRTVSFVGAFQPFLFHGSKTMQKGQAVRLPFTIGSIYGEVTCPTLSLAQSGTSIQSLYVYKLIGGTQFTSGNLLMGKIPLDTMRPGEAMLMEAEIDPGLKSGTFTVFLDDFCGNPGQGAEPVGAVFTVE